MAIHLSKRLIELYGELQYEPTPKRVRADVAEQPLIDSRRAVLIWEPKRVVPSYAVPVEDVLGELIPTAAAGDAAAHPVRLGDDGPPVLDPRTPFAVHSTPGEALSIRSGDVVLEGAAFRFADPELAGLVVVDFAAFDLWREEEDRIYAHPRDPFKRIDVRQGAMHVTVSRDGRLLADSKRPKLLFETHITPRYYLPREDVRMELLTESDTKSECAYKGEARYWSAEVGNGTVPDLCWSYEQPLSDAAEVRDLISFYNEQVDLTIDGVAVPRPVTPWS